MTARYGQLANFFLKISDLVLMLSALWLAIVINYAPPKPSVPAYAVDFLSTRIKVGNALLGRTAAGYLVHRVRTAGTLPLTPP